PAVPIQFDSDQPAAARERMRIFADAAKNGYLVGAAHIAFPGIGHVRAAASQGYTWVPLNYSGLK
ncbi:MAG: MBL fold metallo-hydrolase, partial [Pseudomonadota bacterium]|nr:MBL fold metallo-hydrolase [Pseudomonadota bacterium]